MKKLVVGQIVWLVSSERKNSEPKAVTVSSVGKKYFQLEGNRSKFHIDSLAEEVDRGYADICYLSLQDISDEKEQLALTSDLRNAVGQWGKSNISLEKLRRIMDIIKEN